MERESPMTPTDVVLAYCAAWGRLDMDAAMALLHPQIDYHNIPMAPLAGKAAVEAYLRGAAARMEACDWEVLAVAAAGARVLTERVDRMTVRGHAITLPIMGIFEVEDGLIRRWRDYFDLASYRAQWPRDEEGETRA
jgi:limonene-1,2-epoxide hydrolase